MKTKAILLSMLAMLITGSLWAAEKITVKLKDGTTMEGVVVSETDDEITLKAAGLKLSVDKEDIAEIERPEKPQTPQAPAEKPADGGETAPTAGGAPKAEGGEAGPAGKPPVGEAGDEKLDLSEEMKAKLDKLVRDLGIVHNEATGSEGLEWKAAKSELRKMKSRDVSLYLLTKFKTARGVAKMHLAEILAPRGITAIIPDIEKAIAAQGINQAPPRLIDILGKLPSHKSASVLLKNLPKARPPRLQKVITALVACGNPRLYPALVPYLDHRDARVRATARIGLVQFGIKLVKLEGGAAKLEAALVQRVDSSRYPGNYALIFAYVGHEKAESKVLGFLRTQNRMALDEAVFAAGERRLSAAKRSLLDILGSSKLGTNTRLAAVVALQKIKELDVVPQLLNIVEKEGSKQVTKQIYKTLKGITGQGRLPSSAAAWRKWWREEGSKG